MKFLKSAFCIILSFVLACIGLVGCFSNDPSPELYFNGEANLGKYLTTVEGEEYLFDEYENGAVIVMYYGDKTEVSIPQKLNDKNVVIIEDNAFYGKDKITSVTIPSSVEKIGDSAFYGCTSLKKVSIPKSVKIIDCNCFEATEWISTLKDEFEIVGDGILLSYNGTKPNLKIPNSVKYISTAFTVNNDMQSVDIPSSVWGISTYAFYKCESLTDVTGGENVSSVGYGVFNKTPWFDATSEDFLMFGKGILLGYFGNDEQVSLPDDVQHISSAFFENETVKKVTVNSGTYSIGSGAFFSSKIEEIVLPQTVKIIDKRAFDSCCELKKINLPNDLETLGDGAFYDCLALSEVSIPSNITAIHRFLFYGCESLTSVKMGQNVVAILDGAFFGCTSISEIELPNSIKNIRTIAFQYCMSLKTINIPSKITQIADGTFVYCSSLKEITLPSNIELLGNLAFEQCSNLEKVVIENNELKFGEDIFLECENVVLYGGENSTAQAYATKNKHNFLIK